MKNRNSALFLIALIIGANLGCIKKGPLLTDTAHPGLIGVFYPEALPHGNIEQLLDDVFYVFGTNVVTHDGSRLQTNRTMTIIRENGELTLINSIRLDDQGLLALNKLGRIKNVIRLGAFHGRDDAFYQRNFGAKLYAISGMDFSHGEKLDFDLTKSPLPFKDARLIPFNSTRFKEAIILYEHSNGLLITCDSLKNWQPNDEFFDDATLNKMEKLGSIGDAKMDSTWLSAMRPSEAEIVAIGELPFTHLITAHGPPLTADAKSKVRASLHEAIRAMR